MRPAPSLRRPAPSLLAASSHQPAPFSVAPPTHRPAPVCGLPADARTLRAQIRQQTRPPDHTLSASTEAALRAVAEGLAPALKPTCPLEGRQDVPVAPLPAASRARPPPSPRHAQRPASARSMRPPPLCDELVRPETRPSSARAVRRPPPSEELQRVTEALEQTKRTVASHPLSAHQLRAGVQVAARPAPRRPQATYEDYLAAAAAAADSGRARGTSATPAPAAAAAPPVASNVAAAAGVAAALFGGRSPSSSTPGGGKPPRSPRIGWSTMRMQLSAGGASSANDSLDAEAMRKKREFGKKIALARTGLLSRPRLASKARHARAWTVPSSAAARDHPRCATLSRLLCVLISPHWGVRTPRTVSCAPLWCTGTEVVGDAYRGLRSGRKVRQDTSRQY